MDQHKDEAARINARLKESVLRAAPKPGLHTTSIEGLRLSRREAVGKPEHCFDKPLVGLIVQGSKQAVMGSARVNYGEGQSMVVSVDMPTTFQMTAASPEQPFLALALDLDRQLTAQLTTEIGLGVELAGDSEASISVADADAALLDAFVRIVDLLHMPERIAVLAPMLVREIHYLLLTGPHGAQLRRINTFGTHSNQVAGAVSWMRENFRELVHVDTLARRVNMATSTFHRRFKDVTTLSPLQYLKRLRLYEAQRLMLVERHDAGTAGLAVGYESSAQFSREYKRLFGEPPLRDVRRLR